MLHRKPALWMLCVATTLIPGPIPMSRAGATEEASHGCPGVLLREGRNVRFAVVGIEVDEDLKKENVSIEFRGVFFTVVNVVPRKNLGAVIITARVPTLPEDADAGRSTADPEQKPQTKEVPPKGIRPGDGDLIVMVTRPEEQTIRVPVVIDTD